MKNNTTTIRAKKDLYNAGKCFTKGREYKLIGGRIVKTEAGLMEAMTTNDQKEAHIIGVWWRDFEIIEN
jgi:hypothetical protein